MQRTGMKITMFDHNPIINNAVFSYWVEVSEEELMDLYNNPAFTLKVFDKYRPQPEQLRGDRLLRSAEGFYYLLVSEGLQHISLCNWSYPYSGMWGAYSTFQPIQPIPINSLEDLRDFDKDRLKYR